VLHELHDAGRTIVMITHDPDIAKNAPRRVALRDGMVETDTGRSAA
jgi:ABC-type lipoprotein export system ATPase subunit